MFKAEAFIVASCPFAVEIGVQLRPIFCLEGDLCPIIVPRCRPFIGVGRRFRGLSLANIEVGVESRRGRGLYLDPEAVSLGVPALVVESGLIISRTLRQLGLIIALVNIGLCSFTAANVSGANCETRIDLDVCGPFSNLAIVVRFVVVLVVCIVLNNLVSDWAYHWNWACGPSLFIRVVIGVGPSAAVDLVSVASQWVSWWLS